MIRLKSSLTVGFEKTLLGEWLGYEPQNDEVKLLTA